MNEIKRKPKLRYDRILLCLLVILIIVGIIYAILNIRVKNIYVVGNKLVKDQTIIELASLQDYPKMVKFNENEAIQKIKSNEFITNVSIKKKFQTVIIEVVEGTPIYYDSLTSRTVISNKKTIDKHFDLPILINEVPNEIFDNFISCMSNVNEEILNKISEIKYDPNVDKERFLLTMTDENYVYINLNKFYLINNYLTIISNFKNQKGIIHLDSGSHFEVLEDNSKAKNE